MITSHPFSSFCICVFFLCYAWVPQPNYCTARLLRRESPLLPNSRRQSPLKTIGKGARRKGEEAERTTINTCKTRLGKKAKKGTVVCVGKRRGGPIRFLRLSFLKVMRGLYNKKTVVQCTVLLENFCKFYKHNYGTFFFAQEPSLSFFFLPVFLTTLDAFLPAFLFVSCTPQS